MAQAPRAATQISQAETPLALCCAPSRHRRGVRHDRSHLDYLAYLDRTGLADYAKIAGNRGVTVLRRVQGEHCEFMLISLWESMSAVHEFAGENPEKAVYYPEDEQYLLQMEPLVRHYEVAAQISPQSEAEK